MPNNSGAAGLPGRTAPFPAEAELSPGSLGAAADSVQSAAGPATPNAQGVAGPSRRTITCTSCQSPGHNRGNRRCGACAQRKRRAGAFGEAPPRGAAKAARKQRFLAAFAETKSVPEAAKAAGISPATAYRYAGEPT